MNKHQLTANQKQFVADATEQGFKVFDYSGKGMYGRTTSAIRVESLSDFSTSAKTQWDNAGRRYVVYADF